MFLPMYCPTPQPRFAPDSPITTGIAGMRAPCSQHTTPDNLDTEEEKVLERLGKRMQQL
jgi:hypothetical protein